MRIAWIASQVGVACFLLADASNARGAKGTRGWSLSVIQITKELRLGEKARFWVGIRNDSLRTRGVLGGMSIGYGLGELGPAISRNAPSCAHSDPQDRHLLPPGATHYELLIIDLGHKDTRPGRGNIEIYVTATPVDKDANCLPKMVRLEWAKKATILQPDAP
jgi:hypothetical protein